MFDVEFNYYSAEARVPHIPITFVRKVATLPRVGDRIVHHKDGVAGMSPVFLVREVTHSFEDRVEYQGKSYGGDRIHVTMEQLDRDVSGVVFRELVAKAKGA